MNFRNDWAVAKMGIKVWSAYRFESIVMLLTVPITLIMYFFLWKSIYSYTGSDVIRGFTFQQMISYYVLSMIVGFFTWSEVDRWIEQDLIHGHMIGAMLKPISFVSFYRSFEIGVNLMNIIWQMIPVFVLGFLFFGLSIASLFNFSAFILSIVFAFFIYFGLTFLLGLSAFWLKRITGLRRVRRVAFGFLGGSLIPLNLFPVWAQSILHYLPFEHTRFVPITIYLGTLSKESVIKALCLQFGWVIIIYLVISFVWSRAYRHYSSVGM